MQVMMPEDIREPAGREALFLLPGMTLNETIFPPLERPFVAVDFNRLDTPPASIAGYASIADAVWRRGQDEHGGRWIVVAHSFGGMVTMQWLLDRPHVRPAIAGLLLIGTSPGPFYGDVRLRLAGRGAWEVRVPAGPLLAVWNTRAITRLAKAFIAPGPTRRVDFATLRRRTDLAVDRAGWRNTSAAAMRGFRSAARGFDVRERLAELTMPTIVLHGSRDSLFRPATAHALGAALPDAEVRIVRDAAHVLPLTHPHEVVRAVSDLSGR
jgi:pimeloyl-ACP methyl ester carboxylesterase